MKPSYFLLLIFIFAFFSYTPAQNLETKFQSWNELQLSLPIKTEKDSKGKSYDRIVVIITGNLRVGRISFDLVDSRIGLALEYRINKYVQLMTGATYRKDEITKNAARYETRYDAAITFSKTWKEVTFRNRNMYEHRFRNSRTDTNLYRNRTQISFPLKSKKKEIFSPYISEEGYLDLSSKKWVTNEFFAGINRKINKRTAIELAFVHSDSKPYNVSGLHFGLKIKLK